MGAAVTSIEELNATGIVYAVIDGDTHVSIYPVGGTLKEWRNQGTASICSQIIRFKVVKWDMVN